MRVLSIGIENLPQSVEYVAWEDIKKGKKPNISDYDAVFIDFEKSRDINLTTFINGNKILEVIKADTRLFLFGNTNFSSFLPNFFSVNVIQEDGKEINVLNQDFNLFFQTLNGKYSSLFDVAWNYIDYSFDIRPICINRAGKYIGVYIEKISPISSIMSYNTIGESIGNGQIYFLPSLGTNKTKGVKIILESLFEFSSARQKPSWFANIEIKKSETIRRKINELNKKKIELTENIIKMENEYENLEKYKSIFWEVGHNLEKSVRECLNLIGIYPSEPTKSEHDGLFEFEKEKFMLEIKSSEKGQAKWEELSKLITRMEERKRVKDEKITGIFIMNHFADLPLDQRGEPFPKNVKDTAKVNDVILITTIDLFEILRKVIDEEVDNKSAYKMFFNIGKKYSS